ncbi:MAG: hypothetical protein KC502_04250 [Myxococcales bacterium]|nr:hypothetical protein [Myxococcales bacterium]
MTTSHIFFIPAVVLAGAIFGWIYGRKMLLAEQQEQRNAEARKKARRQQQDDAA